MRPNETNPPHSSALLDPVRSFTEHASLIIQLSRREISGRYKGSIIGMAWSFLTPVLMLAVYTFVFSVVFKARWSTGGDSKAAFALTLFAGLIVANLFSECLTRAPTLITSNPNYVKKIIFPLEILPWVSLCVGLFHAAASLAVWIIAYTILIGPPPPTFPLLALTVAPLLLLTIGISWILASLGVFLRDIAQFVGVSLTALMFLSPIFYPLSALPIALQAPLLFNPLTLPVEYSRKVMIEGAYPPVTPLAIYLGVALIIFILGHAWFKKTRHAFADVL